MDMVYIPINDYQESSKRDKLQGILYAKKNKMVTIMYINPNLDKNQKISARNYYNQQIREIDVDAYIIEKKLNSNELFLIGDNKNMFDKNIKELKTFNEYYELEKVYEKK
jgi:hypothetical protein